MTGGVSRVHLAVGLRVRVRLREVDAVGLMDAHVLIDVGHHGHLVVDRKVLRRVGLGIRAVETRRVPALGWVGTYQSRSSKLYFLG